MIGLFAPQTKIPRIEDARIDLFDYSAVKAEDRVCISYDFLIFSDEKPFTPKCKYTINTLQYNVDSVTLCDEPEKEAVPIQIRDVCQFIYTYNYIANSLPVKISLTPFALLLDPIITPACYIYAQTHMLPKFSSTNRFCPGGRSWRPA